MRVEIQSVGMEYKGGVAALTGVSFTMDKGLHGLLGPNGAGKTTLMKILCTLLEPTSGVVLIDGQDLADDRNVVRTRLGYLPQDWGAPRSAKCGEVLDLVLRLRGMTDKKQRRDEMMLRLEEVGLGEHVKRKVKTLSGGMLRRLGVAQALAGSPDLIVLDEPTVGLDPKERVEFRNTLTRLGQDRTIILSTHIVADVGTTCERVALLVHGKREFEGPPADFAKRAAGRVFEVVADATQEERLRERSIIVSSTPTAEGSLLRVVGEKPEGEGLAPVEVEPNLEDAYLHAVGAEGLGVSELEAGNAA